MTAEDIFSVIEENGRDGVDFITVHCGVTKTECCRGRRAGKNIRNCQPRRRHDRNWMYCNKRENPLYEEYDRFWK